MQDVSEGTVMNREDTITDIAKALAAMDQRNLTSPRHISLAQQHALGTSEMRRRHSINGEFAAQFGRARSRVLQSGYFPRSDDELSYALTDLLERLSPLYGLPFDPNQLPQTISRAIAAAGLAEHDRSNELTSLFVDAMSTTLTPSIAVWHFERLLEINRRVRALDQFIDTLEGQEPASTRLTTVARVKFELLDAERDLALDWLSGFVPEFVATAWRLLANDLTLIRDELTREELEAYLTYVLKSTHPSLRAEVVDRIVRTCLPAE
jgi:hypothetical protein